MPEDRRMTITSSSPITPDEVARHTFASVRRGFDPSEVRDYLESVATALRAMAEREQELRDQLADAEHRAANPVIDDVTLTEAVGKETARVLLSANEAAAEKVANAEAEAARLLAEATASAEQMTAQATETSEQAQARADALYAERTAEAEEHAAALRQQTDEQVAAAVERARAEAEGLLERARSEGRSMVEEAQRLRARVLADLGRRRKALHAQLEQLRAARERMAEAVGEVRRSIDGIADDLATAEDSARDAAEQAGREAAQRADEGLTDDELAALAAEAAAVSASGGDGEDDGAAMVGAGTDADTDAATDAEDGLEGSASEVDALFAKIRAAREEEPAEAPAKPAKGGKSKGGKAAKGAAAGDAAEAPAEATPAADATVAADAAAASDAAQAAGDDGDGPTGPPEASDARVLRRDEAIAPVVTGLARRMKRNLQDEQNELLDRLRGKGVTWSPDLLPDEVEHIDSVATSALPFLEEAAEAGAVFADGTGARPDGDVLAGVARELAETVVGPLRKRLGASDGIDPADEPAVHEHVGSAFREWKGERIEGLAADAVVEAFSLGTMAATDPAGPGLTWIAVAHVGESPCPDCEDNGLHDPQAPGEDFATGHAHPPAHPGCRCVLAPPAL